MHRKRGWNRVIGFVLQTAVFVFAAGVAGAEFIASDLWLWTNIGFSLEFVFDYFGFVFRFGFVLQDGLIERMGGLVGL